MSQVRFLSGPPDTMNKKDRDKFRAMSKHKKLEHCKERKKKSLIPIFWETAHVHVEKLPDKGDSQQCQNDKK